MKWLRYFLVVAAFILFAPAATAGEDPIGWSLSGGLPKQAIVNEIYPIDIVYTFVNNLPFTMPTPLYIVTSLDGEFPAPCDLCSGRKLESGQSCRVTIDGFFAPVTPGKKSIHLKMEYGSNVVPLPALTAGAVVASASLITGIVTKALPATTYTGTGPIPFSFEFVNQGNGIVTNVVLTPIVLPTGFTYTTTCPSTPTQFPPGMSCTLSGTLTPPTPGDYSFSATLNYTGGSTTLTTSTTALNPITGVVTQDMPTTAYTGVSYPLSFTFTNNANVAVTGVTAPTGVAYPAGAMFTATTPGPTSTCGLTPTLGPGDSCTFSGSFETNTVSASNYVTATFNYAGPPASVNTSTVSSAQLVTASVTIALPIPTFGTGTLYPFEFTFTNNSSTQAATGITSATAGATGTPTPTPGIVSGPTNTCDSSIPPGESCTVSGTFQANSAGNYTITGTLVYAGGTVSTDTSSAATPMVTGGVVSPLPSPPIGTGTPYTVAFQFTNSATQPVSITSIVPSTTAGSTYSSTTNCDSSIPANSSCQVTGTFQADTAGTYTVTATLTYPGSATSIAPSTTSTTSVQVVGAVTEQPPSSIGSGTDYQIQFTFKNNATEAANGTFVTNVTISPSTGNPTFTTTSDTCNGAASLGAGLTCTVTGNFEAFTTSLPYTISATETYAGGTTTPAPTNSTTATVMVTGTVTEQPPSSIGSGSDYQVQFTFKNNATEAANGPFATNVTISPSMGNPTFTTTLDTCNGAPSLGAGLTCTVTGNFEAFLTSLPYTISATETYAGGTTAPAATNSTTATVMVTGTTSTNFPPGTLSPSTPYNLGFTFSNSASAAANGPLTFTYGLSPANATWTNVGGTCTSASSIPANQSCTYTGTFTTGPLTSQTQSITVTLTYAGGSPATPPTATGTTLAINNGVLGVITTPLPPTIGTGTPGTPFKFTLKNATSKKVEHITPPALTVKPASGVYTLDHTVSTCGTGVESLASGASCTVSGNFTAPITGDYTLDLVFNYDGKTIPLTTHTNAGRVFTINNLCPSDLWFSFNGATAKERCVKNTDCPNGALCVPTAAAGKGICYWANPLPANKELKLTKGASTKVIVPDVSKTMTTLWSGSLAGRTGCEGAICDTADCNSGGGDKACPPGNPFAHPATQANFTLARNAADTYNVETMNGVNLAMSMSPTTTRSAAANPYFCGTPGNTSKINGLSACTWQFTPPSVDFVWVKAAKGKPTVCTSNTHCSVTGEVCGLSYAPDLKPTFQRICGRQLGHWTARQACALNATDADYYFGCNNLAADNACVSVNGTKNSCYTDTATIAALNALTWLKTGCPTATTYATDSADTSFTCNTPVAATNATDYTITFCPA